MFLKLFCLYSIFVIFKLESISADPLAKEVIRAMDKVISDHVEWDNWEAWNKIMEEVLSLFRNKRLVLNEMFQRNASKFAIFYA